MKALTCVECIRCIFFRFHAPIDGGARTTSASADRAVRRWLAQLVTAKKLRQARKAEESAGDPEKHHN